jgi:hypothetical protein
MAATLALYCNSHPIVMVKKKLPPKDTPILSVHLAGRS